MSIDSCLFRKKELPQFTTSKVLIISGFSVTAALSESSMESRQTRSPVSGNSLFAASLVMVILPLNSATSMTFNKSAISDMKIDPSGYVAYCPCMGRFGNQADQFLGALAFAKGVNRTLILPPWVEYVPYKAGSLQIPFDTYFVPEAVNKFHRAVTMESFMQELASTVWPPQKRVSFCYAERQPGKGCDAKDGNPFGPFWDKFHIDFVGSELFGPHLHYTTWSQGASWANYDGTGWPVLAFVGPPSLFPVEEANTMLQKFLVWNKDVEDRANKFVTALPKGRFIGIHLRNGVDWTRACEHLEEGHHLFASPQCTGYRHEHGRLTKESCFPTTSTVLSQLKRAIKKTNATSIFVASDNNHLMAEISRSFTDERGRITVHSLAYASPHVDLAILGKSNLFIGNCVSSFSAFVKRERDLKGFPSEFWSFHPQVSQSIKPKSHEEL